MLRQLKRLLPLKEGLIIFTRGDKIHENEAKVRTNFSPFQKGSSSLIT